jgi:hypothetical protein
MKTFYAILFILVFSNQIRSQSYYQSDSTSKLPVFEIVLKDGSTIKGKIIKQENGVIEVMTKNLGTLNLKQENIASMKQFDESTIPKTNDKGWLENPSPVSYFLSPSAQTLSKGQVELRNVTFVYNEFGFGLSDNFNVGLGLIPTIGLPLILTAKLSIPLANNLKLGASSTNILLLAANNSSTALGGLSNVFMTIGDRDRSVTVGTIFDHTDLNLFTRLGYNIAGNIRLSNRVSLVGECFFAPSVSNQDKITTFFVIGPKLIYRRTTVDIGMPILRVKNTIAPFILLGATFRLGKK